jgi:hypothetical protein
VAPACGLYLDRVDYAAEPTHTQDEFAADDATEPERT